MDIRPKPRETNGHKHLLARTGKQVLAQLLTLGGSSLGPGEQSLLGPFLERSLREKQDFPGELKTQSLTANYSYFTALQGMGTNLIFPGC